MGFELYEKGSHINAGLQIDQVSVAKTLISFGEKARNHLNKDFIEVYLDRELNRIGLKPSNDGLRGFKIFRDKSHITTSMVGSFIKFLPKGRYSCWIEDDMVVFEVPEIAKKTVGENQNE